MAELSSLLSQPRRDDVVADLARLAETTVEELGGLTGAGARTALAAAKKSRPHVVTAGIDRVLPDLVAALEELWGDYQGSAVSDFGVFLDNNSPLAIDSLLEAADRNVEGSSNSVVKRGYGAVRGKAEKHLKPVLPELGRTLEKHTA